MKKSMHKLIILCLLFASFSVVKAVTTPVTINLKDGGGSPISSGATLKFYDNHGWHTATNNNNGTFDAEVDGTNITYVMYYNNGTQQKVESSTNSSVDFQTTTTLLSLKDSGGNPIAGGNVKYYQNGWSGYNPSGSSVELLPGSYTFVIYYNNGSQQLNGEDIAGASDEVLFTTVSTLLSLKDNGGNPIAGGNVKYYQNGWSGYNPSGSTVELLPGSYTFVMYYNNGSQQLNGEDIAGASDEVLFTTVSTLLSLKDSGGNPIAGGNVKFYQNGWSGYHSSGSSVELLPGSYTFVMYYNNGSQQLNGEDIAGASDEVLFTTVTVNPKLVDCDDNPLPDGNVKYYQNGWSGNNTPNSTIELLPGSYTFVMYYNHGTEQRNGVVVSGSSQDITFSTTQINYVFDGTIKFYQNGWGTYSQGMHFLPGTYHFNFGTYAVSNFEVSGCTMDGNLNIFFTKKADGSPLPNIPIYRNTYGSYYTSVGTTDENGVLFSLDQPNGPLKFKATKDYTNQIIISGPNNITFQTCNFTAHVKHTDGSPFEGVETEYNTYGSYWIDLDPKYTDASGNASIELFAGDYNFRAKKDYTYQVNSLELNTPGTSGVVDFQTSTFTAHVKHTDGSPFEGVETEYNTYGSYWIDLSPKYTDASGNATIELFPGEYSFRAKKDYTTQENSLNITTPGTTDVVNFQTSTFTAHVMKHDGSNFEGIETEYNTYGSYWIDLSPKYTDANGNASIELFPGDYSFRAKKDYTIQSNNLNIASSGLTDVVDFQTALAEASVKDCESGAGVAGVQVEYNTYGSYWIDLDPQVTGNDGLASIELFPGTYNLRAKNIYTVQTKPITLTGPSTTVEFNPTRVNLNYSGTVKYNTYGSYWYTMTPNTYMFPGTYDFRFYTGNTIDHQQSIVINGCSVNESLIFVQLQDSHNNGLAGGDFDTRIGYGGYTNLGIDASGNGYWAFISGHPNNTKVRVSYLGGTQEKQQNITTNPIFIFNTVNVTADLESSTNSLLTADSWEYRYGWGGYSAFTNTGQEFLPTNLKVRVGYKGAKVEKQQNVGSNNHFAFNTVNVTADLEDSQSGPLTADSWEFRYAWESYQTLNNLGEELLPVNVKVRVGYKGAKVEKQQNVGSNDHYDFNTVNVKAELLSSTNAPLTADSWEYRYAWETYKTLDNSGEELLPVNVKVRVGYKGANVEQQQNVNTMPDYVFNTKSVTAELKSSTGATLTADAWSYRYGWGGYSTLDPNGEELLPVNTKVKVHFKGACVEKQQNVNSTSAYSFNTVKVTADLEDNAGPLSADSWNYRYGWGTYYTLDNTGEELLPVKVKVKASYGGKSKEKQQNVSSSSDFHFTWDGSSLYKSTSEDFGGVLARVKVYPNPSDGKFMIENISGYDNLTIYDMTGRLIYSKDILDVNSMNVLLDNPVSGAYIIKLQGVNGSINTPLMIK